MSIVQMDTQPQTGSLQQQQQQQQQQHTPKDIANLMQIALAVAVAIASTISVWTQSAAPVTTVQM
jgi:hypothetical protein